MKFNKILLSSALISILALPSIVVAEDKAVPELEEDSIEFEVSGVLKNETAIYTKNTSNYLRNTANDENVVGQKHDSGDLMKFENSLNLFINSELYEDINMHMQLNFVYDSEAVDGYEGHRINTQNDYLRELYIDTVVSDWDLRIGKQQVVWGTADGVKFLDIINPTDYREWGQNTMEDSRIPLWMVAAETSIGDGDASLQLLWVQDLEINQIPGLYNPNTGDKGQPFISLGIDSIVGEYNGFMNIGKDFGSIASGFQYALTGRGGTTYNFGGLSGPTSAFQFATVEGFTSLTSAQMTGMLNTTSFPNQVGVPSALDSFRDPGTGAVMSGAEVMSATVSGTGATTNLWTGNINTTNPQSIFDFMGDTTFGTFNDFQGMETEYRKNHVSEELKNHNLGLRYKDSTDNGTNYSFNYYYHWDNNPTIDMHWEDGATGKTLTATPTNQDLDNLGRPVGSPGAGVKASTVTTYNLANKSASPAVLVFEENMHRVHSIGGSFDTTVDTDFAPFVIRGEFVYDKGTKQVVMDKGKLAIGDLVGSMKSEDADMIKFVLGADVTVMTNLFVSLQYMQLTNLDYVEEDVQYEGNSKSYQKYTANPATMHITNGFNAAEEHQTGFTLFLSKPFLENDALRVNNIFLYENEEAGIWNRFDLEYSWSDAVVLTAAYNYYGGDDNAVFGQFVEQSNLQAGFKYIF